MTAENQQPQTSVPIEYLIGLMEKHQLQELRFADFFAKRDPNAQDMQKLSQEIAETYKKQGSATDEEILMNPLAGLEQ